jgi:hypothetical protein
MKEIDALKTLKNPAHRWTVGGLIDLIGNGLLSVSELMAKEVFSYTIDQQAEYHDKAQRHHPFWLFDKHGGGQEQGIFEKTKSSFYASLLLIGQEDALMGKRLFIQNVSGHDKDRLFPGQHLDFRLVNGQSRNHVPGRLIRCGVLFVGNVPALAI